MPGLEVRIEPHLGLSGQALAVLAVLTDAELCFEGVAEDDLVDINSYAWYNGRERGICLVVNDWGLSKRVEDPNRVNEKLVIVFAEHRSSDMVFVDCFLTNRVAINPPTHIDMSEGAYDRRRMFDCGRVDQVERYIRNLIQEYLTDDLVALDTFVCRTCGKEGVYPEPHLPDGKFCACSDQAGGAPPARVLVPKSVMLKQPR